MVRLVRSHRNAGVTVGRVDPAQRSGECVASCGSPCVNLGGMTLAVPGSTGFVALAQRAVIGTIDRARSGLRDVRRWWSGAAEPGSECVSDDFAGVGDRK